MKQIEKAEETIDELMPGVNPVCIIHHNEVSDLCTIGSARYEMYLNICADDLRKRQNSLEEEDEDDATNLIKRLCIEIRVGIEYQVLSRVRLERLQTCEEYLKKR